MERHLLQGSSVMVDGRHVGTLRSLIEAGMAIVEIWINEAASKDLLETISNRIGLKGRRHRGFG